MEEFISPSLTANLSSNQTNASISQPTGRPLSTLTISLGLIVATFIAIFTYLSAHDPLVFSGKTIEEAYYTKQDKQAIQTPIQLPYLASNDSTAIDTGYYVVNFAAENLFEPALVFHSVQDSAKIWLNGKLLHEIGQVDLERNQVPPRNRHIPNLVRLSPSDLSDTNTLKIKVVSNWETGLGPITLGEYEQLRTEHEWSLSWRVYFLWAGVAFAVPMALFFLGIWFFYKQSTLYLWLGLVMAIWPFNIFVLTFSNTAVDRQLVSLIQESSNLFYATAMICFALTYRGTYKNWIKFLWMASSVVYIFFVLFVLNPQWELPPNLGIGVLYGWIGFASMFSTTLITLNAYDRGTRRALIMAMAAIIVQVIAVWDILPIIGVLPGSPITYIVQWCVITVLICFSSVMSFELAMALKKSNEFNATLTREVKSQTKELSEQYNEILRLEKQKVISDERSRLIEDMHDGTSGQLVSIISGMKSGRIQDDQAVHLLEYCVRDLRSILDSMNTQATDDLARAIAMFKERVSPLLEANNLATEWNLHSLEDNIQVAPQTLLNIYRILQEALTNIIKHANADKVVIQALMEENGLLSLSVLDNGCGISPEQREQLGYGRKSMFSRAQRLGGALEIESEVGQFTRVKLALPPIRKSSLNTAPASIKQQDLKAVFKVLRHI